ncbi:MAG: ferritin-like domain-containing protein [Chitinophagales bacterium]|nr:ferritin-like domain-containing protein [Chitinophagales bacterium]
MQKTLKSIKPAQNGNGTPKATVSNGIKAKPDAAQGLRELFVDELKDIYWAEKELTKAIPKMIKNATADDLAEALTGHLEVTKKHVTRLEEVFSSIGVKAQAKKCEAMAGLTKEAEEIMEETEEGVVRDAGIILAGQKVEHYEIATYGTLFSFAKILGEDKAASLLEQTLKEEKEADKKLSEISDSINVDAADEENEEATETPVAVRRK